MTKETRSILIRLPINEQSTIDFFVSSSSFSSTSFLFVGETKDEYK